MKKALGILSLIVILVLAGYFTAQEVFGFPLLGDKFGANKGLRDTSVLSLGQFLTNLKDEGRFIKVSVDVSVYKDTADSFLENLSKSKTEIYALLRSKTYAELEGDSGLHSLKEDMFEVLTESNPGSVQEVFFSEFIIH